MYEFITEWIPLFVRGFKMTLILSLVSLGMGFVIGLLTALGDVYGGKIIRTLINIYVEFFRGSPLLVQVALFYYTIPDLFNTLFPRFPACLLVFTLNTGAYQKGYIKGAIGSVFKGQMKAARSLGLSKLKAIRYIVLPQALRIVIPAWINEFASMAKSTSAAIMAGLYELTTVSYSVSGLTFRYFETYSFTALIYFIWIFSFVKILEMVYEKVKIPGFEA